MSNAEENQENLTSDETLFGRVFSLRKLWSIWMKEPFADDRVEKYFALAKAGFGVGVINYTTDYANPWHRSTAMTVARKSLPPPIIAGLAYGIMLDFWEARANRQPPERRGDVHLMPCRHLFAGFVGGMVYTALRFQFGLRPSVNLAQGLLTAVTAYVVAKTFEADPDIVKNLSSTYHYSYGNQYTTGYAEGPLKVINEENERRGIEL